MYSYLENGDAFWQLTQLAKEVTIEWGKKGAIESSSQTYTAADEARSKSQALIDKKLEQGFSKGERVISLEGTGSFFTSENIEDAQVAAWTNDTSNPAFTHEILSDCGIMRVLEVEGNLHVPGNFRTFEHKLAGLIVHGDLIVDGLFQDSGHPQTCCIIHGNVIGNTVFTSGQLEVFGNLDCEMLVGDYNDYSCAIKGTATADVFFEEEHNFEIGTQAFRTELGTPNFSYGEISRMFVHELLSMPPADLEGMSQEDINEVMAEKYFDIDKKVIQQAARECRTLRQLNRS